jgi:hypothetical protein
MAEVLKEEETNIETIESHGVNSSTACPKEMPYLTIFNPAADVGVEFRQIKITGFSDTVTPSWNEEIVYGRMDPIATYQGTTRAIELSFDLGPFSESDDRKKLALMKISRLMQMQYPTYSWVSSALSISQPPLLEISFHNYIRDQMCYLTEVSYNPVDGMDALTTPQFDGEDILPQRLSVSLSLKVLHTEPPGWMYGAFGAPIGPMEVETETGDDSTMTITIEEGLPRAEFNLDGATSHDGWEAKVINTNNNRFADTSPAGELYDLHPDTPGINLYGPGSGMED